MLVALVVAGAFFMENLDGTVIATVLPDMARSFGVSPVDLGIGMTAYMLTLAVFIPISGWVADRLGARTVFATAIVVFTAASALCAAADSLWAFTAARVVQGIGGAMMVPVGRLAVLRGTDKRDLMRAVATITWPALVAPVIGPPLGGFIATYASWRWIFLLNVPLGLVALALALRFVANHRGETVRPFDAKGFLLSGIAFTTVMYALELVGRQPVPWLEAGLLTACGLATGLPALRHLRQHAHPLIDLSALRVPTFAVTVWGGSLFRIAIGSAPFLLPLMFQVGFGLSAFESGLLVLAVFAGNLGMKTVTTPVLRRFGFRRVLIVNGLIVAASLAAVALLSAETPRAIVVAVLFAGGLCRSMQFTALNTLSFADMPKPLMSGASTLSSMVGQMTMGLGIAVAAIVLRGAMLLDGRAGGAPAVADFHLAFAAMALVALAALADVIGLHPDAGAEVSGHRSDPVPVPAGIDSKDGGPRR